jgi:hypothetical protein
MAVGVGAGPELVELTVVLPVDELAVGQLVIGMGEADEEVGHLRAGGLRVFEDDLAGEAA